jgi:hypothetical protein
MTRRSISKETAFKNKDRKKGHIISILRKRRKKKLAEKKAVKK